MATAIIIATVAAAIYIIKSVVVAVFEATNGVGAGVAGAFMAYKDVSDEDP